MKMTSKFFLNNSLRNILKAPINKTLSSMEMGLNFLLLKENELDFFSWFDPCPLGMTSLFFFNTFFPNKIHLKTKNKRKKYLKVKTSLAVLHKIQNPLVVGVFLSANC